ncbi:hypothetical protein [Brevundimonas sp.]|jgi:hypothetical protein|uniref:hypothetical protein n=1 Tax=Brevundimonas sp. TaxID=1871086 RepID=UPI002E1362B9|nr:hypothetical protein [Brevundimonas sp.]
MIIRIFGDYETYETKYEDYGIENFGGVVPSVGDIIVSPGVTRGADRNDPDNRTLYVVKERYWLPSTGEKDPVRLGLVVATRTGMMKEVNVLGD